MVKQIVRAVLRKAGYDIHSTRSGASGPYSMERFLANVRASGFYPKAVLDVGANRTRWSRTAKRHFPAADCYLIEPQYEMEPLLQQFCTDYPGSRYFLAAAGADEKKVQITLWDDLAGSSLLPRPDDDLLRSGKQRLVPVVTIDGLVRTHQLATPALVKLDVQGYELEALRGAGALFGNTELFILEVSLFEFMPGQPILHKVILFMAERGYFAYEIIGFGRRPLDLSLAQLDIVFARDGGPFRRCNDWG